MSKNKNIIISTSMAFLALHAMSVVANQSDGVVVIPEASVDADIEAKIDAAVSKKSVSEAVAASFSLLAAKFGESEVSIGEKYFPGAFNQVQMAQTTSNSRDFTASGCYAPPAITACHAACHSACHSACHGSRSWR
jgi:hypothetical protein